MDSCDLLYIFIFVSFISACKQKPEDVSNGSNSPNDAYLCHRNSTIDSLAFELVKLAECHEYYNFPENKSFHSLQALLLNGTAQNGDIETILRASIAQYTMEDTITQNLFRQLGLKPILETEYEEAYRFNLYRSFQREHVIITASRFKKTKKIETIVYELNEGQEFFLPCFSITHRSAKYLNDKQWFELISRLEKANFWSLAPHDQREGYDGSTWTIESKTIYPWSNIPRHHYVERWTPCEGSSFKEVGLYLIELSGIVPGRIF